MILSRCYYKTSIHAINLNATIWDRIRNITSPEVNLGQLHPPKISRQKLWLFEPIFEDNLIQFMDPIIINFPIVSSFMRNAPGVGWRAGWRFYELDKALFKTWLLLLYCLSSGYVFNPNDCVFGLSSSCWIMLSPKVT